MRKELSLSILKKLLSGSTFQSIGDEFGYSKQYIHKILLSEHRIIWQNYIEKRKDERNQERKKEHQKVLARRWRNKPADRFWENVNIVDADQCWEWKLARLSGKYQYGRLHWGSKNSYAHQVAMELTHGEIPEGMYVCHKCDNPICCNPNHLFFGTQSQNVCDAVSKGRWYPGPKPILNEMQINFIRENYVPYVVTIREFSEKFQVSWQTIFNVLHFKGAYKNDENA